MVYSFIFERKRKSEHWWVVLKDRQDDYYWVLASERKDFGGNKKDPQDRRHWINDFLHFENSSLGLPSEVARLDSTVLEESVAGSVIVDLKR